MKVLVTGADGFIGKNLCLRLAERKDVELVKFTRNEDVQQLPGLVADVDVVFHLAGVNRPPSEDDFASGNTGLTQALCGALAGARETNRGRATSVVFTSSTQAMRDNAYGRSKLAAEDVVRALEQVGCAAYIARLPNVFGKWCRPNYNSAVATFCHNIARDLPIQVNDPGAPVTLVYVDDVINEFMKLLNGEKPAVDGSGFMVVSPQYSTTVGELASLVHSFKDSRNTLTTERVGTGLTRALYATYVSYLPVKSFAYPVARHEDPRGVFVEMLKTPDCGQFSFFTAHPGVTRGGHYHHTKTEKFLVIKGSARFKFRQMHTGEYHELVTHGDEARIVETVPGWTHDITNIGSDEMVVMLWANEIFDRSRPDTVACPL